MVNCIRTMGGHLKFKDLKMILLSTIAIFSLSYLCIEVYGIEYTENEWGLGFEIKDPWKLSSSNSSSNSENLCNNKANCLIVLDNRLEDKISSITISAERGNEFKNKCQCDSLIKYVQFDYNKVYGSLKDFSLIGDNETSLNGNKPAWQMEYSTNNKDNAINHLVLWTINNDIFYKLSYHGEKDSYSKYLPSVKELINNVQFVVPTKDSPILSEKKLPSFITTNNTKEQIKKQPSFMINKGQKNISLENQKPVSVINNEGSSTLDKKNNTNTIKLTKQENTEKNLKITKYSLISNSINSEIIGELINPTNEPVEFIKIGISVYENGKLVEVKDTYADIRDLNPNQTSTFSSFLDGEYDKETIRVEFKIDFETTKKGKNPFLSITVANEDLDKNKYSSYATYKILGHVTNSGPDNTDFAKIIGIFYDEEGNIIDQATKSTEPRMLGPGETTTFEISVFSENAQDIESYKLLADSDDYTYSQITTSHSSSESSEDMQSKNNDDEEDEDEDKDEDDEDDTDKDNNESTEARLENMFNPGST